MSSLTDRPRKRLTPEASSGNCSVPRDVNRRARPASRGGGSNGSIDQLPKQVRTIFDPLEPAFSRPTHRRFVLLALAAILTLGGRTDHQPAPRPGRPGPRTPQQLSPRLLAQPLVAPGPGTPLCRRGPRPLRARRARSSWPATTPSPSIPGRMSTARAVIATRSARRTPTPRSAGVTSGSSWPCWSPSPGRPDAGHCRCWSRCIDPRRRT